MRIGISLVSEGKEIRGIGVYTRELIASIALANTRHDILIFLGKDHPMPIPDVPLFTKVYLDYNIISRSKRHLFMQAVFPFLLKKYRLDVLHSIGNFLPVLFNGVNILTIHDLHPYHQPERFDLMKRIYTMKMVYYSAHKADRIITVSETSKETIVKHLDIDPSKIDTIYIGVPKTVTPSGADILEKYGIKKPYVIQIGTLEPGKNHINNMEAFARAKREADLPHQLVIVGGQGWCYKPIIEKHDKIKEKDSIILTGYVKSLAELARLLIESDFLLFTSLNEGFGLPMVEAFEAGIPVLTSNISAMPEVAGDAALLVDPYDVNAIKEGIIRLARDEDLRKSLIARGKERRKMFSWSQCAFETIKVYESFINM